MDKKVFIGIPCMDHIKTRTVTSLFTAASVISCPAKLNVQMNCYIHVARNNIVREAIENNASHVMFIDSDMEFEQIGIERLLNLNKDIVGGLYYRRQPPHLPTINQIIDGKLAIPTKFPKDKPFKVFAVATGFMLIKTSVLKKIDPPWFGFGKMNNQEIGEDIFFCKKANEKGFEVWCDPVIKLGHCGEYVFGDQDYEAYQDVRPKKPVEEVYDGIMK